jgi:hypothetical protein
VSTGARFVVVTEAMEWCDASFDATCHHKPLEDVCESCCIRVLCKIVNDDDDDDDAFDRIAVSIMITATTARKSASRQADCSLV